MARILCVTAHPDDEAANFGGAIRLYSDSGHDCRLICMTAGAAARHRGTARNDEELKSLRRAELAASCSLLGFASHECWDLPDAHLPQTDFGAAAGRLVAEIRTYQPEIVLCMGPEGSATAHPDHAMSGVIATAAFHWAGQEKHFPEQGLAVHQARRLFYATFPKQPPGFPRVFMPPVDVILSVDTAIKVEAFRCHTTQAPLFERVEPFLERAGGRECYHLEAGEPLPEHASDLLK